MSQLDQDLAAPAAPVTVPVNSFLDAWFYDVTALTADEVSGVGPFRAREGDVLVVPPSGSGRPIAHYESAWDFLAAHRDTVRAVAVAGVGSTALGTAALARNVANAYGVDAAAVVSGYGLSDLLAEAMGGWFFFGAADAVRHSVRQAVERWQEVAGVARSVAGPGRARTATELGRRMSDVDALAAILNAEPSNLSLVVGHSKGCLMLDYALERFVRRAGGTAHPYYERLAVATFGAVVDLPPEFARVHQFLGAVDWFGGMNSRWGVPHTKVPGAWHHLNDRLPFHLSVETVLRDLVPLA